MLLKERDMSSLWTKPVNPSVYERKDSQTNGFGLPSTLSDENLYSVK